MADIDVERKGPSIWPWVIGLLVLALLIWAIAEMVDTDEEVAIEEEPVEEVTEEPAAVPQPEPTEPEMAETEEIETLMPLGPEDAGTRAEIEGTVVGDPIESGFWVATEDETVVFVRSDRTVETGDDVDALMGTIETVPEGEVSGWADQARLSEMEGYTDWDVQNEYYLNTMAAQPGQRPAQPAQPMPADTMPEDTMPDMMEKDTVPGR